MDQDMKCDCGKCHDTPPGMSHVRWTFRYRCGACKDTGFTSPDKRCIHCPEGIRAPLKVER